jgi:activator of HSP90 ATPase
MNHITESIAQTGTTTRRQVIAGIVVAFGGLVARPEVWGAAGQQSMKEMPVTAANKTRTSLHQEIDLKASPRRIYEVLLDSKQFAAFSGMPAKIDPKAGGAFTTFGGQIEGRTVELVANQRVVQAWRPTDWDPGVYSIVRFELKPEGASATVVLDHTGFPEGDFDHLAWGWNAHYWEPLKKFLA